MKGGRTTVHSCTNYGAGDNYGAGMSKLCKLDIVFELDFEAINLIFGINNMSIHFFFLLFPCLP